MGILTEPKTGSGKLVKFITKWEKPMCYFLYIAGIIWLINLANPDVHDYTYFSENALLPGLVKRESNLKASAERFHRELSAERETHPDVTPYAWILAKFHSLHLDVYTHNFTLNYPFQKDQKYYGQNIYGIVRAARAASTEAIIISAPYRPVSSIHPDTTASIALLLAFAEFCRKQNYWAKDIIFLVTEHEQLGMQAWLDAYHGVTSGIEGVLEAGDLPGRAGSIQAAINLEFHAMTISYIDVKVEGLNGQLPNLDLFNLVQNMIVKEEVYRSFQGRMSPTDRETLRSKFKSTMYYFHTMMSMILNQATGIPTGNHGLYHRFGIEAVTLEGFKDTQPYYSSNFYKVGRIVESIVRSLNNLLERFHQSYFFYLLLSVDKYVSIALYFVSLVLITAGLFIKGFCAWTRMQDASLNGTSAKKKKDEVVEQDKMITQTVNFDMGSIASEILWAHIAGAAIMTTFRTFISYVTRNFDIKTEDAIFYGFAAITVLTVLVPFLTKRWSQRYNNVSLICIFTSVEFATVLLCTAMHNFSLALIAAIIYIPVTLMMGPKPLEGSRRFRKLLYIVWPLLHPFIVVSVIIVSYTFINYSEEPFMTIIVRALQATKHAFLYSLIDSMVYGNWLFNIIVAVMLPIWSLYWNVFNVTIASE